MSKFYLLVFFIIGANCECISPIIKKEIRESYNLNNDILNRLINLTTDIQRSSKSSCATVTDMLLQKSVDQLIESVADNKKHVNDFFERILVKIEKKLDRTEQVMHQRFVYISEDLQKSNLNTDKLQTSVEKLRDSVTANKKSMNEEHDKTSSILNSFGHQLDDIERMIMQQETQNSTLQKETQNCSDLYNLGKNVSMSYLLPKFKGKAICDMETDGGGWLFIQRRRKVIKQVDFNTTWASYREGFGDLDTEFWIGNEFLHRVTNQKLYELRIDMEDFENGAFYATYNDFRVGNEDSGYQLHVGGYEGNVTDSLSIHNDRKFTTFDRDNDHLNDGNCAEKYSGGFWYYGCGLYDHLNGMFPTVPDRENRKLIRWNHNGENLVLMKVEMKIRPKQEQKISI